MTADMTILEAIGIGVGAVATVLGGVWFIVNKAFGVGRFSHRMEEVDKRTCHAACDVHDRDIGNIKDDIRAVKADVESIKRGNAAMMSGANGGVSLDGRNVSVRCRTVGGVYTMTFAKERIVREASKAFKRVVK